MVSQDEDAFVEVGQSQAHSEVNWTRDAPSIKHLFILIHVDSGVDRNGYGESVGHIFD